MDRTELFDFAFQAEANAHEMGWDSVPMLHIVRLSDSEERHEIYALSAGHPMDLLPSFPEARDAEVICLITEGWAYPEHVLREYTSDASLQALAQRQPPSEHPQRVEVRQVVCISRDVGECAVSRIRGQGPEGLDHIEGRIVTELRRIMGTSR